MCQKARITINVQIVNNKITFQLTTSIILIETASIDTNVGQIEATGGKGQLQYSIIGGNDPQTFRIDPNTGQIYLNQTLDYGTTQSYVVIVHVVSTNNVSGNTKVSIEIQDVNEQPTFITPCAMLRTGCTFNIAENSPASTIAVIQGNDPDLQSLPNGILKYQLSSKTLPFTISPNGTLSSTMALDRELQSSYSFTLTLSDSCNGCSLSASTTIQVLVTDVNDNPPVFSLSPSLIQVQEDQLINSVVGQYAASDADDGNSALIEYSLEPDHLPFTLGPTGILKLTGEIDYERVQSYSITVTASNPGTNMIVSTDTLIQIENVDDNTPVITGEPYILNITENTTIGTLLTTVTATDGDLGVDGEIQYSITTGNIGNSFAMNSVTGALTTINDIDREIVPFYSLEVQASGKGSSQVRKAVTTIAITVTDINDNSPVFNPDTYYIDIKENLAIGMVIGHLLASDADQPNSLNAFIAYSITSGNTGNTFSILDNGYIQISKTLDYETTSSYSLAVEGKDGGFPALSASAKVRITITNVNENIPTLTGDQSLNISESTPINTILAILLFPNLITSSSIAITSGNYNNTFYISPASYKLALSAPVDYETVSSYLLVITASSRTVSNNYSLMIRINDENEFSPTFENTSGFEVNESNPRATVVGVVVATDKDSDDQITYEMVGGGPGLKLFHLNATTGLITTNIVLDREELTSVFVPPLSQITLRVAATDNGSPSRETLKDYTITLVDVNDNRPTFSDTIYSNKLRENLPPGQVVFYMSATDIDLGTNSNISYSFALTNNIEFSYLFLINSQTGTITTAVSLDYEMQMFYLFLVTATDAGSPPMSSTVIGNLTVLDENDNSPLFSQSIYIMTVTEDFAPGILNTFTATDNDQGTNGELEYAIILSNSIDSNGVIFNINKDTGALRTTNYFDYEVSSQVNVTIIAVDKGLPRLSALAIVTINVLNVDEQKPQFPTASCDAIISEDTGVGAVVTTCLATDSGSVSTEGRPPIAYSITNSLFEVNPISGTITTKAALDREIDSVVTLDLRATDASGLVSNKQLNIFLLDVNDNSPHFLNTPYKYYFTDNIITQYKQEFLAVSAADSDICGNGAVSYSTQNIYRLNDTETLVEVLARDAGIPPMATAINVSVTFQSLCQYQAYTISPNEGILSAHLLCSVTVTPAEYFPMTLGHSANLTCSILRNSPTTYQWLHNGTTFTNPAIISQNSRKENYYFSEVTYRDSGKYACRASSLAGGLQSSITVTTIQSK